MKVEANKVYCEDQVELNTFVRDNDIECDFSGWFHIGRFRGYRTEYKNWGLVFNFPEGFDMKTLIIRSKYGQAGRTIKGKLTDG